MLRDYDDSDREYYKLQIADTVSYYHQRMIGDAIVERDFTRYQFDVPSGELIEEAARWRPDLPAPADPLITQDQAESMVPGQVRYSVLYFVDPDSVVFPIAPTPENVCWVVRSAIGDRPVLTIIDAMTGQKLGRGIPPPAEGFSLTGPGDEPNCADPWEEHCLNAYYWFNAMGYETSLAVFPLTSLIEQFVASYDLAVFYELAHGHWQEFANGCPDHTTAGNVEAWLANYDNVPFAFIGSCFGLCQTGDDTFAHEFRKGLDTGAAVVGYCEMSEPHYEIPCWPLAVDWQNALFSYLSDGWRVESAFDQANLAYPPCADNACMRWAGDGAMTLVPKAIRSLCGDVYDGYFGPLQDVNTRPYYLACDIHVPSGQTLTFDYGISVEFLNNAQVIADGTADATAGNIRFLRELDPSVGMKVHFGQVRMSGGGAIRIYD